MTRIPEDILIASAHKHLAGLPGVFVAPHIPPRKEQIARKIHALHLPADEPVLAMYDATALGGAEDGFLVTPTQLCYKGFLEHPRRMLWDDLAHTPIYALDRHVSLRRGEVPIPQSDGASDRVRDFLEEQARRARAGAAPYRDAARSADDATLAATIQRVARNAFGELTFIHYAPSIPTKMLATVRAKYAAHLAPGEEVLVLYDDTLLGSGADGFLLTERGFCWRPFLGQAGAIAWRDIDPERVTTDGARLLIGEQRPIDLATHPGLAGLVATVLRKLAHAPGVT